ncbi:MAG: energy transducer TonB [Steroidobacteraceae bacterium]
MEAGNVTQFPDIVGRSDSARTSVLVFTRDATLIDTVRKASPRDATVIQTSDLDQVSDQLASVQPDVLVLDAAGAPDAAAIATQVSRQFPDLVLIVAGRREEGAGLMKLTASGQIYRFLLVPLALGQTRLTLEAALRRRVERSLENAQPVEPQATSSPPRGPLPKFAVPAGIAVLAIAAIAGWFLSRPGTEGGNPAATAPVEQANTPVAAAAASAPVQTELSLAAQAMERQQFVEPPGNSALEHYRAALGMDPRNAQAQAGIRAVADRIVERAEAALLAERTDQAVVALELARNIQGDHPRLAFLDAQLQRERERLQLTQARDVSARLRTVLQQVNQRMESGRLLSPAGQSARDALFEARRLDPTEPAVIQGFRDLTSRLITDGDKALSAGQRDQAVALAAAARDLSPSDARIAALERSLADQAPSRSASPPAATAAAATTVANATALGRARLGEGRLLDPAGDSAKDHLLAARAANANDAEVQRLLTELKDRLIAAGRQSLGQQDFDGAGRSLAAALDLGVRGSEDSLASVQRDLDKQRADADFKKNVISAGSLQRTRTVAAVYPEGPRRRGVTGWVDLQFTVTVTGTVEDITVVSAEPAAVFDAAAITAVKGWRFAPVVRAGSAVPQRAATRLRFDISN